jgi:hypothetical protein
LRYFYDAVSRSVAHAAIEIQGRPPGDWPEREALLVVTAELGRLRDAVGKPGAARLRMRRAASVSAGWRTLDDVAADVMALGLGPYTPGPAQRTVATARRRLRKVLCW